MFKGYKPFIIHHLGAATAFNLIKKDSNTESNKQLFQIIRRISKKDIVLLTFGEIDCRIHTYYQFKKNNEKYSLDEIIDKTVSNYGAISHQIREKGIKLCICSVSPTTTVGNEYNVPFYASPEIRSHITRKFNEKLQEFCTIHQYPYINIYPKVSDENGIMLKEYAGDQIHLNNKVIPIVRKELNEIIGITV